MGLDLVPGLGPHEADLREQCPAQAPAGGKAEAQVPTGHWPVGPWFDLELEPLKAPNQGQTRAGGEVLPTGQCPVGTWSLRLPTGRGLGGTLLPEICLERVMVRNQIQLHGNRPEFTFTMYTLFAIFCVAPGFRIRYVILQ